MNGPFTLEWNIEEKKEGITVKQFLKEQSISRTALTDIKFKGGDILVNGQHVTVQHLLEVGDNLKVIFPEEVISETLKPEAIPLSIIYEDEAVIVVNKPPFMSTIPSREHPQGSLANALLGYYQEIGLKARPHIVTRLDRNTSGLVLVAKHRHVHHLLSMYQKENLVKREYEALVEGTIFPINGIIEAPIGRKADSIIERAVTEDGQYAKTHFSVINQYVEFAHVKLTLETGRTHQIRVHMAYMGHPIMGDDLYGGKIDRISRQSLHCKKISFTHPINQNQLEFTAELYDDMKKLLK